MTDEVAWLNPHPAIGEREPELRALADAVRRLTDITVTNVAPSADLVAAAADLEAVAERLARHVPDPHPPRYYGGESPEAAMTSRMPYDVVIGPMNPLAPPIEIELDPPRAIGRARFTTPYEGPPGCVHGAVIAGAFDMVLAAANHIAQVGGPTAKLTIRYRRPTRLFTDTTFEAEVAETNGRRITTVGRIVQDGEVTAEAEGLFVVLGREQVMRLGEG